MKNLLGYMAYILEGMRRLSQIKAYRMRIESEELSTEGEFLFGMVTNSTSVGGFKRITGKYVQLDDGEFEVTLIKKPANPMELNMIMAALLNRRINTDCMYCFKSACVKISAREEIAWTLDGEFGGRHRKVDIHNQKQGLSIRVPEGRK
jgi:diacylglycerol kinase family enzyme